MAGLCTLMVLGAVLAAVPSVAQQVTAGALSTDQDVGDPVGSCDYGSLAATTFPGTKYVASVGADLPLLAGIPINGCGACFRLVCSDTRPDACVAQLASVTVQIVDLGGGQLLSVPAAALSQIATPAVGNLKVTATQVPCPQVGDVIVRIIGGAAASLYLKLVLLNAGPVRDVAVASVGSQAFSPLANTYGAVWETNRLPTAPLDLQYTDASGLTHLARNAIPAAAGVGTDIAVNFGGSSSSDAELALSAAGMADARKLRQTGLTGDVADQGLASLGLPLTLPEPALLPEGVPSLPTSMPEAVVTEASPLVTAAPPEGPSLTLQVPSAAEQAPSPAIGAVKARHLPVSLPESHLLKASRPQIQHLPGSSTQSQNCKDSQLQPQQLLRPVHSQVASIVAGDGSTPGAAASRRSLAQSNLNALAALAEEAAPSSARAQAPAPARQPQTLAGAPVTDSNPAEGSAEAAGPAQTARPLLTATDVRNTITAEIDNGLNAPLTPVTPASPQTPPPSSNSTNSTLPALSPEPSAQAPSTMAPMTISSSSPGAGPPPSPGLGLPALLGRRLQQGHPQAGANGGGITRHLLQLVPFPALALPAPLFTPLPPLTSPPPLTLIPALPEGGPPVTEEPPLTSMEATAPAPIVSPVTVNASAPAPGPPVTAAPPLISTSATAPAPNASALGSNASAPAPALPNIPEAAINALAPANTSGAATIASAPSPAPAMISTSPAANLSVMAPAPAPSNASSKTPPPSNASSEAPPPGGRTTFDLKAAVGSGANCSSIFSVLALDPDLRNWTALLKAQGVDGTLNNTQESLTVFAPINNAFAETVFAPNNTQLGNARSVQDLLGSQPASANPIIGYHILPSAHRTTDFTRGLSLNTTDTIKGTGVAGGATTNIPVNFTAGSAGSIQVQGVGSYADILQGDIPACGPSFIHIIDHVLLPFNPKASTSSTPAPAAMEMSPTSVSG